MNKTYGIIFAILVLLGGTYIATSRDKKGIISKETASNKVTENESNAEESVMMKKDDSTTVTVSIDGNYGNYDSTKLINAEKGDVVLFFHAGWCPKCITSDKNFKSTTAPSGLTLMKLDFDNSFELRKKYGVTLQHTFVQVDKDGNMIKKWNGSNNYSDLKSQIE